MCKVLPITLHGFVCALYHILLLGSILHFHDLKSKPIFCFNISIPAKKSIIKLFTVTQQEDENIEAYLQWSNEVMINMERFLELIAIEALISRVYNYSFWKKLYSHPNKNLLGVKDIIKNHIMVEKASITRQGYLYFHTSQPHHQYSMRASKRSIKGHIYGSLTSSELMTTHLTTTWTEVLVVIQRKDFLINDGTNIRKFNKFCIFHHDNEHYTKECHTLNKEVERLIATDLQKNSQS
jgi:hypothetical protein